MKTRLFLFYLITIWMSCQSTGSIRQTPEMYYSRFSNLGEALRRFPALSVSQSGNFTQVHLRKNMSQVNSELLYVVDGHPVGNSYQMANQLIQMDQVRSIRLIDHLSETVTYGSMASAGVIDIRTVRDRL